MNAEEPKSYNAEIYLYSRATDQSKSIKQSVFKHRAVVIKYLDKDEEDRLPDDYIYEGFGNEDGSFIVKRGFFNKKHMMEAHATLDLMDKGLVCKTSVEDFCDHFNSRNHRYALNGMNCQVFADELLAEISMSSSTIKINTIFDAIKYSSTNSSQYITTSVWAAVKNNLLKWLQSEGIKEGIKLGSIEISNELAESLMRNLKGMFSPWQLFQIPAEIITKLLVENGMKKVGYEEELSKDIGYASSKLASLGVAFGVGFIGGPMGALASVGFWLAAEILTYIIRKILEHSKLFNTVFGKSPNERCFERFTNMLLRNFAPRFKEMFSKAVESTQKTE